MEHAADTAEAAAVDHSYSTPAEKNSFPVCVPGIKLAIVLFDAPSKSSISRAGYEPV